MSQLLMPKVTFAKVADRIYKTAAIFVVLGTVLFLAAGRLNWMEAWIFLGIYLSGIGLGISAVALSLILYSIWDEERLLRGQFGMAWQTYVHHSWRLIPYVF